MIDFISTIISLLEKLHNVLINNEISALTKAIWKLEDEEKKLDKKRTDLEGKLKEC